MALDSEPRRHTSLKTYSRRVNNKFEEPSSKKRSIEEVSTVKPPPQVQQFKCDSIRNYFKPLLGSSIPEPKQSLQNSYDLLEPHSTPTPTKENIAYLHPRKPQQRQPRRLTTRPTLSPVANMSERQTVRYLEDDDNDDQSFDEVFGSLEDDSRLYLVEKYLDREEQRDLDRISIPQFNPTHLLAGTNNPLRTSINTTGPSTSITECKPAASGIVDASLTCPHASVRHNYTTLFNSDSISFEGFASDRNTPATPLVGKSIQRKDVFNDNPSPPINITKRKSKKPQGYQQSLIDLGQKRLVICKECTMQYNLTDKADRELHIKHHGRAIKARQPKRVHQDISLMDTFIGGLQHQIRVIDRKGTAHWHRIFEGALEVSLQDLGGATIKRDELWSEISNPQDVKDPNKVPRFKIYVYLICLEPVAVLLAERISEGVAYYRGNNKYDEAGNWPLMIDPKMNEVEETIFKDILYPCWMSVDRIWTHINHRRNGYASLLVDYARQNFIPGLVLSKKHISFSLPTNFGREFASAYCKDVFEDAEFLVNLVDAPACVKK